MKPFNQITIEIRKHDNKDYTMYIYEKLNYFSPVMSIKKPVHWNKCVLAIGQYLRAKKVINVFQKKSLENELINKEDKLWLI